MKHRRVPTVFVSSTCYDLQQIRRDIKDFIGETYGFNAMLSEFDSFPVNPCVGTFENCLDNVDNYADVFILIVGNRYGCVNDTGKSITNLEYLHAKQKGIPILVFVNSQLHNNLPLWRANKEMDFSSVVDNPKVFEFVAAIYDESKQWVYTFNSFEDLKLVIKKQFAHIFADGLYFNLIRKDLPYAALKQTLSPEAMRALTERPYAWEYKFLAYVIKNEFNNLNRCRWDFQYGFADGDILNLTREGVIEQVSTRLELLMKYIDELSVLINKVIPDAIADPGVPSDLELMQYVAKRLASTYERLIVWGLSFKCIKSDDVFEHLLELLYQLPQITLAQIDKFIDELYDSITNLPDVDDCVPRKLSLKCTLDAANVDEINAELERLRNLLT